MMKKEIVAGGDRTYEKIERYIEDLLVHGSIRVGDRLISEREIGKKFNASTIPVRRAMRKFVEQGILEKIHGRGTFVRRVPGAQARTNRIAILHCHDTRWFLASPFYALLVSGIQTELFVRDKIPMITPMFKDGELFPDLFNMADEVDGLILVDLFMDNEAQVRDALVETGKPAVVLNYDRDLGNIDTVNTDNYGNMKAITSFLASRGHRRIGFIYTDPDTHKHPNFLNRKQGYLDALDEHGIARDESVMLNYRKRRDTVQVMDEYRLRGEVPPMKRQHDALLHGLMNRPDRPTALVCVSDDIALRVMEQLRDMGMCVPGDVTVVGHDGIEEAGTCSPALTTMDTGLTDMGAVAVKRLMEKCDERQRGTETIHKTTVPGTLVVRESHRSL